MRKSANDSEIQTLVLFRYLTTLQDSCARPFHPFSTPIQAMIRRYGAPSTSSIVGSHHTLFSQGKGLTRQPAAPRHAPTMETVAAGFLRLIHEQTVILLTAITPADIPNRNHAMNQRKCIPISGTERAVSIFLPCNRNLNRWWECWKSWRS